MTDQPQQPYDPAPPERTGGREWGDPASGGAPHWEAPPAAARPWNPTGPPTASPGYPPAPATADHAPWQPPAAQAPWADAAGSGQAAGATLGMLPGRAAPAWPPVAPTPPEGAWRPERFEAVPGTGFAVAHLAVQPVASGLAIGALMAGIASILVSMLVLCFGLSGAEEGWGAWVAGAFAVLAGLAGLAGVGLGLAARRQIRQSTRQPTMRFTGHGLAVGGISCGGTGLGLTLLSLALVLVLQFG